MKMVMQKNVKKQHVSRWVWMTMIVLHCSLFFSINAHAQTFTSKLQQQKPGEGKVTVTQSKDIENLVNGVTTATTSATTPTTAASKTTAATTTTTPTKTTTNKPTVPSTAKDSIPTTNRHVAKPVTGENPNRTSDDEEETEPAPVDMSKKLPRHSYKVNGFRVQAFAGGNSRADKQKAEQAGRDIKMHFPDLPIYVHFYSPQWKCRVGNFRSYEEASNILRQIKALGYKQACIVKGKISIQY